MRFYCEKDYLSSEFQTLEIDQNEKFDVSELLDIKTTTSGFAIKVRWLGFDETDDTWEPVDILYQDIPLILHDFLIQKRREVKIYGALW
jgi:hypothetical protein